RRASGRPCLCPWPWVRGSVGGRREERRLAVGVGDFDALRGARRVSGLRGKSALPWASGAPMRTQLSLALLALGSGFVFGSAACDSPAERRAEVQAPGPVLLPPSAVSAAVRALETLDASRAPDTLVELR